MDTRSPAPLVNAPSLGRLRLAVYAVAVVAAACLWLLPKWFAPAEPSAAGEPKVPLVNTGALKSLSADLEAWRSLLQDSRLEDLQPPAELPEVQPGNPSPFFHAATPNE